MLWGVRGFCDRTSALVVATALLGAAMGGCGSAENDGGFAELYSADGGQAPQGPGGSGSHQGGAGQGGQAPSSGKGPPYPIVLAHGFFGCDEFAGLEFADYFFGVKEHLASHGEVLVYTPAVDPFNTSVYRGAQLAAEIAAILELNGYAKVNIIGHSQGGLDGRVVAHDYPDMVASVLSVATPHHGTPIADIALGLTPHEHLLDVLDMLLELVGQPVWDEFDEETSVAKPLQTFSEEGIAAFNAAYPEQPGVNYASITGRSDRHDGGYPCQAAAPPFVSQWNDELDPIDPLFAVTEMILDGGLGEGHPNDGLVRAEDAEWGDFLGCVPADHIDEVGHLFGDAPGMSNSWRHLDFYLELVSYLRQRGL